MIAAQLGKCSVNVDVISEPSDEGVWQMVVRWEPGGWLVFEVTAAGFGPGDMFLHWGVGKQCLDTGALGAKQGPRRNGWCLWRFKPAACQRQLECQEFGRDPSEMCGARSVTDALPCA